MARVERVPGRRKAAASPRPPRLPWSEAAREQPARARGRAGRDSGSDTMVAAPPAPTSSTVTRRSGWSPTVLGLGWLLLVAGATGGLVALRLTEAADLPRQVVATGLGVLLAVGLAVRSGGRAVPAAVLAVALGGAAVVTQWEPLLAGAAVGTGVLAACLAVLGTVPAPSFPVVVREVVLALLLASAGALAVNGFAVPLDASRYGYAVLVLGLAATIALVYRLGAGLHGLGPRGVAMGVAAIVLLAVALAYTEALAQWGPPGMTDRFATTAGWVRERLGATPRPIEVLVGIPALAWGVSMRARRRQGWWVCAFGTTATATATARLIESELTATSTALSAGYGLLLGLVLGYVAIRLEQSLHGSRGRRAMRGEDVAERRPEPDRLGPLH